MQRFQKKLRWQIGFLLCCALILYVIVILFFPYRKYSEQSKQMVISHGMSIKSVGNLLEREGVIYSARLFDLLIRLMKPKQGVAQGTYLWNKSQSLWDVAHIVTVGQISYVSVLIPEGWNMIQIFRALAVKKLHTVREYKDLSRQRQFLKQLNLPPKATSLEGFLAPDTYKFSLDESSKQILSTMVHVFYKRMPRNYAALAHKQNLSYYDAIILASIIEKETSKATERRLISSVFHNRLRKPMPLQTDPTVIYGAANYKGVITKKMLRKLTPYNTYRNFGLTPTPISNPGLDSIIAAVSPKKTKYLYFVAKGDGGHYFSATYAQHRKAIKRYQKRRSKHYRSY